MKTLIILLNIFLAAGIGWSVLSLVKKPEADAEDEYFFRHDEKENAPSAKPSAPKISAETKKTAIPEDRSAQSSIASIVDGNIFDPARCPNARSFGRRTGNERVEMSLVGTFAIGDQSGAIILQKRQRNTQNNFMPGMAMFGAPMMPAFGGGTDANAGAGGGGMGGGSGRQRFGPGAFPGGNSGAGRDGSAANGTATEETPVVYQQYVRVGETLANGYKLVSVSRTGAVLARNSERLELEIAAASKNTGATFLNPSNNTNQQNRFPMNNGWPGMMGAGGGFMPNGFMMRNAGGGFGGFGGGPMMRQQESDSSGNGNRSGFRRSGTQNRSR